MRQFYIETIKILKIIFIKNINMFNKKNTIIHYLYFMAKSKNNSNKNNIHPLVSQFLKNRGIDTESEMVKLLEEGSISDPFKMKNIEKICNRIKTAIDKKEKIVICGDYDADGTVSTSMLVRFFREINVHVDWYIPHRVEEGYGISAIGVENLVKEGAQLLISVDNGIAAFDAGEKSIELNVDLIITDHHDVVDNKVPNCYAILNPKIEDDFKSSYRYLAGAGVALYLIRALKRFLKVNVNLDKYLLLCTLASIADVVPLRDENRTLVKKGLKLLPNKHMEISGLKALLEEAGLNLNYLHQVTAQDIAFKIAPMLNAAGRLEGAEKTILLLIEDNYKQAKFYAEELKKLNLRRRAETDLLLTKVTENTKFDDDVIVAYGKDYHQGIIGIVAGKIKEKLQKPTIVVSLNENGIGKASCRSIEGFNIVKALEANSQYLEKFGGHYMAAGFEIKETNLSEFINSINNYFKNNFKKDESKEFYDFELSSKDLNDEELLNQIMNLEPFGAKLELPKVLFKGKISDISVFKNQHIKIQFDNKIEAWLFFDISDLEYIQSQLFLYVLADFSVKNMKPSLIIKKVIK